MSLVVHVLKSPLYLVQLVSGTKSFEKNPILGSRRLNAMGLHVARIRIAMKMAAFRRKRLAGLVTHEQREDYERDGFVKIENFLDDEHFAAVKQEIVEKQFERYDMRQGRAITRRSMIDRDDLTGLPALERARNDSRLLGLVRYVASHAGQPLITLQTVLAEGSDISDRKADPQTSVHSDTFHATAKAWLFLEDVGEDDGPFSYVPGSHRMTEQRYAWEKEMSASIGDSDNLLSRRGSFRIQEDRLSELGYSQPVRVTAKANTLVVADTHGFHARSPSLNNTIRIEIYASLRRNPFLPFTAHHLGGFHIAAVPAVRNRLNRLVIDGLAFLQKLGIRNTPWTEIGRGDAREWIDPKG